MSRDVQGSISEQAVEPQGRNPSLLAEQDGDGVAHDAAQPVINEAEHDDGQRA